MDEQNVRPSRSYYALAGVVIVAGAVVFALTLWKGLARATASLQQVVAPGTSEITLPEPGTYTVYYEHQSVIGNRVYSTGETVPGLVCTLASKRTGAGIRFSPSRANATYSFGGRVGRSVLDFQIEQPGMYVFSSSYPQGRDGSEVVLAVGRGSSMGIATTVLGSLAVLFGSIALGMVIFIVTLLRRHQAFQRLRTAGGPPPPIE